MTGANGNGGASFNLELRALWTDESRLGTGGKDRIFFLVRYEDDDNNAAADRLAYVRPRSFGDLCPETQVPGYCPSDPPLFQGVCDPALLTPERWERLHAGGQEDQVVILLREVPDPEASSDIVDLNRSVLAVVGPELIPDTPLEFFGPTDLWIWRAGRSNLHPVPQYPNWDAFTSTGLPEPANSRFLWESGFAEDGWIDHSGVLRADGQTSDAPPWVKNFARRDPIPDRLTQCPEDSRGEEEVPPPNVGVPVDLALWWPTAESFGTCDTMACTRVGQPRKWSTRLQAGEYDYVPGWGLQVPGPNKRDVRAKGTYSTTTEKGFGVRAVEFMRDMTTGASDDLAIHATDAQNAPVAVGRYRLTIGIYDNSGRLASGSPEVYLRFAPPAPAQGGPMDRCTN
jgi:hypothetical protein